LSKCDIRDCNLKVSFWCFYTIKSDGDQRSWRTYRFCAFHGKEIQGGVWEDRE